MLIPYKVNIEAVKDAIRLKKVLSFPKGGIRANMNCY